MSMASAYALREHTPKGQSKGEGLMRQHVIDQLRREGLAGVWTAEVCERAGYKCEYCDRLAAITRLRIWPLAAENVLCGLKEVGIQSM